MEGWESGRVEKWKVPNGGNGGRGDNRNLTKGFTFA
jgi:hypothetical protein